MQKSYWKMIQSWFCSPELQSFSWIHLKHFWDLFKHALVKFFGPRLCHSDADTDSNSIGVDGVVLKCSHPPIGGIGVGLSVGQCRKPTLTTRVLPIIIKTKNSINLQTLASFYLKLIWFAQKKIERWNE